MTVTKTILAPLAVLSLLAVSVVSCDKKEDAARLSDSELAAQFSDPSNEWRGKPFWAWKRICIYQTVSDFREKGAG